jgi:hypothetical protein
MFHVIAIFSGCIFSVPAITFHMYFADKPIKGNISSEIVKTGPRLISGLHICLMLDEPLDKVGMTSGRGPVEASSAGLVATVD